jgi:hypothetical protein
MKRFALTLMAVALTGAMAFADDAAPVAKLNGYVNSGLLITSDSSGTTYVAKANDFGGANWAGKITGSITGANYGASVTVDVVQGDKAHSDAAYVWASPLAGLKIFGGSGYDGSLGEVDNDGVGNFGGAGLTTTYAVSGLTAGFNVVPAQTATKGGTELRGAVRYAADKLGTVNVFAGSAGTSGLDAYTVTASLAAVDKLNFSVGYNATKATTTAVTLADVEAGYQITDAFKADVVFYDYLAPAAGTDAYMTFKPNVSYTVSPALSVAAYYLYSTAKDANGEAQLSASYNLGGGVKLNSYVQYDTKGAADKSAQTTADFDVLYSF